VTGSGTRVGAGVTAVVFDLGNVLIDWDPLPAIAAGVGDEQAAAFFAAEDFDFLTWNHQLDSGMSCAEGEAQVAREHPHWHPHVVAYREHFDRSLIGAVDESVAVLEDLVARDIDVFGLTNWPAELFPVARERFGFLELLHDIVVSGEEGAAKPDPAIFAVLADRVRRPLAACAFTDDRQVNVDAAAAAGLDAFVFTDPQRLRADLVTRGLL
jgi:2-haloacid dehalogenase